MKEMKRSFTKRIAFAHDFLMWLISSIFVKHTEALTRSVYPQLTLVFMLPIISSHVIGYWRPLGVGFKHVTYNGV
jgi:hypothetical protein